MKNKLLRMFVLFALTGVLTACGEDVADTGGQGNWPRVEATAEGVEESTEEAEGKDDVTSTLVAEETVVEEAVIESTVIESTVMESSKDGKTEEVSAVPVSEESRKTSKEATEASGGSSGENERPKKSGESSAESGAAVAPATAPETSSGDSTAMSPSGSAQSGSASAGTSGDAQSGSAGAVPSGGVQSGSSGVSGSQGAASEPSIPVAHTCDYGSGVETIKAGCQTVGERTYTCSCGATKTETIAATGHNMVSDSKAATCTENGYERKICSSCGHVESESTTNATGHSGGTIQYYPCEPFCTAGAFGWYVCDVCGEDYDAQRFPALGHELVQYNYRAGDCSTPAMWDVKCGRCEERMEFDVKGATDPNVHNYVTVNLKEWDEVNGGFVEYQVVRCSWCFKVQ